MAALSNRPKKQKKINRGIEPSTIWEGDITVSSDTGDYTLTIIAEDAAENVAETTVDYSVVTPTGGLGVAILPKISSAQAGTTLPLDIKIVRTENFDDILHVYLTTDGIPADYQADLSWLSWTDTTVQMPAGHEIVLSIAVDIPDGIAGYKSFGVKVESTMWGSDAQDYGAVLVTDLSAEYNVKVTSITTVAEDVVLTIRSAEAAELVGTEQPADISWFDWTSQSFSLAAGAIEEFPLHVSLPAGVSAGDYRFVAEGDATVPGMPWIAQDSDSQEILVVTEETIPEFSTIAIPVAAILGLFMLIRRRKRD